MMITEQRWNRKGEFIMNYMIFWIITSTILGVYATIRTGMDLEKLIDWIDDNKRNKITWRICIYKDFNSKQVCTPYIDFNRLNLETIRKKLMKVEGKYAEIRYIQNDEIYIERSVINKDFICYIIQSTNIF